MSCASNVLWSAVLFTHRPLFKSCHAETIDQGGIAVGRPSASKVGRQKWRGAPHHTSRSRQTATTRVTMKTKHSPPCQSHPPPDILQITELSILATTDLDGLDALEMLCGAHVASATDVDEHDGRGKREQTM